MEQRANGTSAVIGEYVVGARLERGPVADVHEATHVGSGAPRLVYLLLPASMADSPLTHRVICEADAARWLRHPAIAKLEASGDAPEQRLYVAVERPAGQPLGAVLATRGRLSLRRVVRLASRLVEALDEAHAVGLVHGRLTPASVYLGEPDEQGRELVTLAGLGTAALVGDAVGDAVTEAERPYVSPEQRAGAAPDARSDVFGLASLLVHAIEGAPPAAVAPTAADGVWGAAGVLAAARAADPAHRPPTVKALWEDLLAALVAEDVAGGARPVDVASAAAAVRRVAQQTDATPASQLGAAGLAIGAPPTLDLGALDDALDLDALALELLPSLASAELTDAGRETSATEPPAAPVAPKGFGGLDVWVPAPGASPVPQPVAPRGGPREAPPEAGRKRGPARAAWDARRHVLTASERAAADRATTPPPRRAPSDGRLWWIAPIVVAVAMGWPVVHEARHRAALARAAREVEARTAREAATRAAIASWRGRDAPWVRDVARGGAPIDTLLGPLPDLPPIDLPQVELPTPASGMGTLQLPLVRPEEFAPLVRLPSGTQEQ